MGELAGIRVLLVEDEVVIALSQSRLLQGQGCVVLVASSGQRAVEAVEAHPDLDMVLMDINLGAGMDGTEAAKLILAIRDLPLIFLSSHTEKEVVERTEEITNYGYILKSAGETVLFASMKMALRLFRARATIESQRRDLQESERHFRSVFELASVGIIQVEPTKGRILNCNDKYCQILGYSREELLALNFPELTYEADRAGDWVRFRAAVDGHGLYANEKRYVKKDGSLVWVRINATFIRDADDQVLRSIAVVEDIGERKAAEAQKAEALERYRHAFDELLEGCQILDSDLRYLYVNSTAARHGRTEAEALLGRTMAEVYPGIEATPLVRSIRECLATGRPEVFDNHFSYPDGAEAWFELSMRRIPEGVLILSQDLSEARRTTLELRSRIAELQATKERQALFASLFEMSSQPIGIGMPDGSLGECNDAFCALTGYSKDELHSLSWATDLTPEQWRAPEREALETLLSSGRPVRYMKEYRRRDGSLVPVELLCHLKRDSGGAPAFFFSFVEDISERLASRQALEASLQEKETLYLELQHRVKNSLFLIASVVDLEESSSESPEVQASLRSVRGRIGVLSQLYQLLGQDIRTEVDLSRYIGTICDSLSSTYGGPGIALRLSLEPVVLDLKRATSLGLIVNELVTNSYKHAFPEHGPGEISLSLERGQAGLVLELRDNGRGLPGGFTPETSKGLGFRLIQELCRQLGATLERRSEGGSHYLLRLPLG